MENSKRQYAYVDICKFIAAVLIVLLHIDFAGNQVIEVIKQYISRLGVPYFFLASGFFLGKNLIIEINHKRVLLKYLKRVLALLAIWSCIYAPYHLIGLYQSTHSTLAMLLIFMQKILFLAPSYMWYLMALAVAAVPFCLFFKRHFIGSIVFTGILYIIGTLGNSYLPFVNGWYDEYLKIFLTTRNGVFFAPLFMNLGGLCAKREYKEVRYQKILLMLGLLYILFGIEVYFVRSHFSLVQDSSMYFLLPFVTYFLFKLTLKSAPKGEGTLIIFLRNASTVIYCSQFGFILIYSKAANIIGLSKYSGLPIYIATIISAIFLTRVIVKTKNKYLMKLL